MLFLARALALLPLALMLSAQGPRPRSAPPNAPARIRKMDPKQRQSLLENLPPDRRKQAAERLDRLESLSPGERKELEQRWEHFRQLSPEDREKARGVFRDFNALSEKRREAISSEFARLRALPLAERSSRISSAEYKKQYSKKELQIIQRYAELPAPTND